MLTDANKKFLLAQVIGSLMHLFVSASMRKEWKDKHILDHLETHTVRSHSGMGGCWGRGFFKCDDLGATRRRAKASASKAPSDLNNRNHKSRIGPGHPRPSPNLRNGSSSGNGNGDGSKQTAAPNKANQSSSRPAWNDSFASSAPRNASTTSILPAALSVVSKHVRKLSTSTVEMSPQSFFLSHSLTGGTGSGVTSRLLQALKDEHPKASIYTYTLSPFVTSPPNGPATVTDSTGPLHSYNSLLALVYLQQFTDGVILRSNSDVMRDVKSLSGISEVKMFDVNNRIATDLSGLLLPLSEGGEHVPVDLDLLFGTAVVNGSCKIAELRTVTRKDLYTARGSTVTYRAADSQAKVSAAASNGDGWHPFSFRQAKHEAIHFFAHRLPSLRHPDIRRHRQAELCNCAQDGLGNATCEKSQLSNHHQGPPALYPGRIGFMRERCFLRPLARLQIFWSRRRQWQTRGCCGSR